MGYNNYGCIQFTKHPGVTRDEAYKVLVPTWVASPDGSPHRSGRAIDLKLSLSISNDKDNVTALMGTDAFKWLDSHAKDYRFYVYTNSQTGKVVEPWHYNYNPPAPASK